MRRKEGIRLAVVLFVLAAPLMACSFFDKPALEFVPLPPPVGCSDVMNIQQVKINDAQLMSITSPSIAVMYRENGDGVGKTATEVVEVNGQKATMLQSTWGDWENAELYLNEYFGTEHQLVRGMVTLMFEEASILQLFTGHGTYTVDRSYLTLVYDVLEEGEWPVLVEASYTELWGLSKEGLVFLGGSAVWNQGLEELLPSYGQWGFWEVRASPADVVAGALETVVAARLAGVTPNYEAVDHDSPREMIGRQTGFTLYQNGAKVGRVGLEYRNNWGRMPNTNLIGDGALSLVEWHFGEQYYALLALTPPFSPAGSTLYLFVDDPDVVAGLFNTDPVTLYSPLREGTVPGVFLAIHTGGDIGRMKSSVQGGDGGSVTLGDEGGVQFRTLGNPTYEDVALASNLLASLGRNGLKGLGLYYAYKAGSGSGLCYYLAAMRLILADPEIVLDEPWFGVGVLDMVGIPNLATAPFVSLVPEPAEGSGE